MAKSLKEAKMENSGRSGRRVNLLDSKARNSLLGNRITPKTIGAASYVMALIELVIVQRRRRSMP